MQVIKHIMVHRTYDEKLQYDEYLRKVEEIKFQMAERYRLHPNNFVTKKNGDDVARDCDLPFYLCGHRKTLVIDEWETWGKEDRQKVISQNGNTGEHYYGEL
jgi:hypothetical protein